MHTNIDPQVLGKILLLQNSLSVAPDERGMGEQLCHVVSGIPGVKSSALYLYNEIVAHASPMGEEPFDWPFMSESVEQLSAKNELLLLTLQTNRDKYGALVIVLSNYDLFSNYQQFLENTLNFISLLLENRKQARELQKEKDFLNTLLDTVEDGIVACDENGLLTLFNPATRKLHGLTEQSLPPEEWAKYYDLYMADGITPMDKESVPLYRAYHGENVQDYEMVIAPKEGERKTLLASGKQLTDAEGKKLGAVVSMHDITARKEAEEELKKHLDQMEEIVAEKIEDLHRSNQELRKEIEDRKATEQALTASETKYKELADSLPQIVFELDLQGNITYSNLKGPESTGYSFADIEKGLNAFQMVAPEEREKLQQNIVRIMEERVDSSNEYTLVRKDGATIPVIISTRPIISEDRVTGFRGIIVDITDRKKVESEKGELENQLRQAYKMEAVGTMAGGIAHDFNNILSIIINANELISEDSPLGSQTKNYSSMALKAANRAKDLVKQILAFSRLSSQVQVPVQPHLLIKEDLKLARSTIPASVEIRQNINSNCGFINADPTQIHQLVMNLCSNAVHAMDEKGVLEITLNEAVLVPEELLHKPGLQPGNYIHLSVSDTGCGMNPDMVGRIFDPFFTTKEVGEGTGMGLSVVHGIVENHGGMVKVESDIGSGTTFHFYFPKIDSGETLLPDDQEKDTRQGSERILFVDDEEAIALMGGLLLQRLGYKVTVKTSCNEALEIFKANPDAFDLVITDQTMPNMSGVELAAMILQERPAMPIILCTGFSKKISKQKAKEHGIKGFLLKPFEKSVLASTVRNVLDGKDA